MTDKTNQATKASAVTDTPAYAAARTVDFSEIPVIDLSEMTTKAGEARIAKTLVRTASEIGFFYVSGHGIPANLSERAMAASRASCALDEAGKGDITVDKHQRGWMAQGLANLEGAATHDAKEVFFWGREVMPDDVDVVAVPLAVGRRRLDGNPALTLQIHRVHFGADAVFCTNIVNGVNPVRVEQDSLGQSRLPRVDVGADTDVTLQAEIGEHRRLL